MAADELSNSIDNNPGAQYPSPGTYQERFTRLVNRAQEINDGELQCSAKDVHHLF